MFMCVLGSCGGLEKLSVVEAWMHPTAEQLKEHGVHPQKAGEGLATELALHADLRKGVVAAWSTVLRMGHWSRLQPAPRAMSSCPTPTWLSSPAASPTFGIWTN